MSKFPPRAPFPILSLDELRLLRDAHYDNPLQVCGRHESTIAKRLLAAGLVERDPSIPLTVIRRTAAGEDAARPLTARLAAKLARQVTALRKTDPEAATSLERALWQRVLLEVSDLEHADPIGALHNLVHEALRTAPSSTR